MGRTGWLLLAGLFAATASTASAQGRRGVDSAPKQGSKAPDFVLHRLTKTGTPSKETVKLSKVCAKKPVALVFGSYT